VGKLVLEKQRYGRNKDTLPSLSDLRAASIHKYKCGLVIAHNGLVYKYTVAESYVENIADLFLGRIEKYINLSQYDDVKKYINELKDFGVELEVL
jgi:hypothetical protein